MKVLLSPSPHQPLPAEKVEAVVNRLAAFLGIDAGSILVLPAGLSVQVLDPPPCEWAPTLEPPVPLATGQELEP